MNKKWNSLGKTARLSGLFWILGAITTVFSLFYVQSALVVSGDATATANNILANQYLFRLGIVCALLARLFTFCFGLTIFHLFREISKLWTTVLLAAILIVVAVGVGNSLNSIAVITVINKPDYLNAFGQEQLNALAMLFLRLSGSGQVILEVFWLPYLFSFGLLIVKSRYVPRIFGIFLIIGSFGFPLTTFSKILVPQSAFPETILIITQFFTAPGLFATNFWLLIKGVKEPQQIGEA